ncbi:metallophosphoesterase family protein, partial [Chloroflexota bacterium]
INSGLPEEGAQWAWLEETLAEIAGGQPEQLFLFTHLPLFIRDPYERLDQTDYRNRYLVIAPPGRDRLLDLVRRCHVSAVFTGHAHVPWEMVHEWPEGFTTRFITTGSSGPTSAMAVDHFDLPLNPDLGLGYHEHRVSDDGLSSRFHPHIPPSQDCPWELGQAWTTCRAGDRTPDPQGTQAWYEMEYVPSQEDWRQSPWGSVSEPAFSMPITCQEGMARFVRQTFVAEGESAGISLELLSEGAVEVYLNGELHSTVGALGQRPPTWESAGGTYTIDSPALTLGLSQDLVRQGENVIALRIAGDGASSEAGYIAYNGPNRAVTMNQVLEGKVK